MRAHLVVMAVLVAGLSFFMLRPILRLIRLSARVAVWLVLLGIVIAATVLATQQQKRLSPTAPTYQATRGVADLPLIGLRRS